MPMLTKASNVPGIAKPIRDMPDVSLAEFKVGTWLSLTSAATPWGPYEGDGGLPTASRHSITTLPDDRRRRLVFQRPAMRGELPYDCVKNSDTLT
jgi:hypothetical protein